MNKNNTLSHIFLDCSDTLLTINRYIAIVLAALSVGIVSTPSAQAAEKAGMIIIYTGKVEIVSSTEKRLAKIRAPLYSGDTILTGEGQVQIRFDDGAMLTLYRDTRFSVDNYRFGKGSDDRAQFSLIKGLMHTITGSMDKKNYQVKTALATLGVRGTEYTAQMNDALRVSVVQGSVELVNAGGTILVGAGGSAIATGPNVMPKPSMGGKLDLPMHGSGGRPGGAAAPPPPPPGTSTF